jgi:hypothetical protein
MNKSLAIKWISAIGIIAVLFGIFYGLFGLDSLPVYQKFVPRDVYQNWANGLYGSVFIGFGVLLFFAGRHAFQTNDKTLMKALLYGVNSWLVVEAIFSLAYGVYINVAVDLVLIAFLSYPLMRMIKN